MPKGRVPPRLFAGDWPANESDRTFSPPLNGCGPQMTEQLCEACERLIAANGECGCST